ncbi:MAG: ATP synthase F1 subunit epsilon [Campylobacterota bacterium]|nr:ATP synthase F1 subunit epsilon [Campylobacterota bacterium]
MGIKCSLVTPERELFTGEVDYLCAQGMVGEFGVLPGHTPFITLLKAGIAYVETGDEIKRFALISGFCQVSGDYVIILADEAYTEGEINREQAEEEYKNAISELDKLKPDDPKYNEITKRVDRAKVLVDIAEKR